MEHRGHQHAAHGQDAAEQHGQHQGQHQGHAAPHDHGHHAAATQEAAHEAGHHAGHHAGHAGHGAQHGGGHAATWRMAALATLHCLTGCAIGEVLGMVIGTAAGLHNGATVVLSVALAFVFGYALTMRGVLRAGVGFRNALKVALAADTVSIAVMELLDNAVMVGVPGAMDSGLGDPLFWSALAGSLLVAFLLTTPVNKWLISRGKGHAVMHAYHH
ncbi:DUF4396 domain-containing protein [Nonomuraea pusilla]|uniref:DUF4396 domain-containing protein n=1 Tax=Nonomuraea pusilla TaxID=46177 RepID=A0A1H8J693_9ACTN|nr:DUF4396 domain-containing protein [Nonomuraea pusilla]SEN76111.1 protein of unknown function [Nonomuraea pusilla]